MNMNNARWLTTALVWTFLVAVTTAKAQDTFLDRQPPPVSASARQEMEKKLQEARDQFEKNPNDPDAMIWLGRRLAYLGKFREAIEVFSSGIEKFPGDARFFRHRGHRRITVRQFDLAVADLERAAQLMEGKVDEIEPDGQPNERNIPTSTLKFNIWYHLGLAYYIKGENVHALFAYTQCAKVSGNPDRLVAMSHWLYMTLRRLDDKKEAARLLKLINSKLEVIENTSYWRLLLMYRGDISFDTLYDEATKEGASAASHSTLYGLANWKLIKGERDKAAEIYKKILASEQWTSFGYIAAEADMKRFFDR